MSTSERVPALVAKVACDAHAITVVLDDGRIVRTALSSRLQAATPTQRAAGRVEDAGTMLRWDEIDEDLSVAHLIGVTEEELDELAEVRRSRSRVRCAIKSAAHHIRRILRRAAVRVPCPLQRQERRSAGSIRA